jgi:hypothetical protein
MAYVSCCRSWRSGKLPRARRSNGPAAQARGAPSQRCRLTSPSLPGLLHSGRPPASGRHRNDQEYTAMQHTSSCVYVSSLFLQASYCKSTVNLISHCVTGRHGPTNYKTRVPREEKQRANAQSRCPFLLPFHERYVRCAFMKLMRPFVDPSCDVTSPSASSSGWITFASCLPSSTLF